MHRLLKEIKKESKVKIEVLFYNVWSPDGLEFASRFNVRVIPTILFFDRDGLEYYRSEGFLSKEELINNIRI